MIDSVYNETLENITNLDHIDDANIDIVINSGANGRGITWNFNINFAIQVGSITDHSNVTSDDISDVMIKVLSVKTRDFLEERNITIILLELLMDNVTFKWINPELCVGISYAADEYRIMNSSEVYIINRDRYYSGNEFTKLK